MMQRAPATKLESAKARALKRIVGESISNGAETSVVGCMQAMQEAIDTEPVYAVPLV
jgi:hypothetical protein